MITDYQLALLQQFYMKRASDIARDKMVQFRGQLREFRRQFTLFPKKRQAAPRKQPREDWKC